MTKPRPVFSPDWIGISSPKYGPVAVCDCAKIPGNRHGTRLMSGVYWHTNSTRFGGIVIPDQSKQILENR